MAGVGAVHNNEAVSISGFTVDIDQNPFLPAGGLEVNAIVTVTAEGTADAPPGEPAEGGSAEIILLDCSRSMAQPPAKFDEARAATAAALDVLTDGTWFAIIAGNHQARPVYPADGTMALAGDRTRAAAKAALRQLTAGGGTAIGEWLRLARQVFSSSTAARRHAILLTDGKNEQESSERLDRAIALCEGAFRCDCRGLGTDWEVGELLKISTALLGTLDIVADPAELTDEFARLIRDAVGKQLPDVLLRVWTPQTATIRFVKQVAPAVEDLTGRRRPAAPQTGDYPTGAWAPGESRDYHVAVTLDQAHLPGQQMLAARVSLVTATAAGEQVLGQGLVQVTWTDDEARPHAAAVDEMALDTRSNFPGRGVDPPYSRTQPPASGTPANPSPPVERFLLAQMPARVPIYTQVSLMARISTDRDAAPAATRTPLAGFAVSPTGTQVTVVVQAPSALRPVGALQQVITVTTAGDPPPVRFEFIASEPGPQRLVVTAWAGGTFLAELDLELSVDERTINQGGRYEDAPDKVTTIGAVRARAGEVTLQVRFDGQRYTFQLLSEPYLFEPVPAEELSAHPSAAVERTVATLRSIAEGTSGYSGRNARTWMERAGVGLWNDMVPQLVKEQFWQLREHIGAFSIVAGGDVIPWELLYPLAPGHDEGFLVEQFPVLRRVYGQQRSRRLAVSGARYVLPASSPANARAEIAAIRRVLGQDGTTAETIADLDALVGFIESGDCGSLHFACHNSFKSDAGGSAIAMGGGSFVPLLLNKAVTNRALAGRNPLIFINACRSAGAVPEYTRMAGWAQQFMAAGAGAFVGTLWAVGNGAAQAFAEAFYAALASGDSLGEASRHARVAAGRDQDDPAWLAYSVYGDPAAQAAD